MDLLNNFSKEESTRRVHNIGCCHSASHQFTNHNSGQFRDDACPSGLRSEPYENEAEIEELFEKNEDLCVVCGFVSANEFFSFPSDVDTRKQWATFCDLPLDKIKPYFRLCDRHFKPDDYRIQRKLLIQTSSVPTLQPKLKNSINISNPTSNENTSKNAICSPVVQGNLRSEVLRLRTRCSLLEDTVAELKRRIDRQDERCSVVPAEIDRNIAEHTRDRRLTIYSSEKPEHSSSEEVATASIDETIGNATEVTCHAKTVCSEVEYIKSHSNADAARPEDHSKKDFPGMSNDDLHNTQGRLEQHSEEIAHVEPVEKVADEDGYSGYSTDSSMPPLEIPIDGLHTSEGPLERFSEEEASLAELIQNITEDHHYAKVSRLPREISSDDHHNSEEQLEPFSNEVAPVETAENMAEDAGNTNLIISLREQWNDSLEMNAPPEKCSEGDSASKDSRNCFSNSTKATDDVFLNVLEDNDNEVFSGFSVSPQINGQLRRDDTAANSNNEQFHKAHVGQTLRMEQVRVTTQKPNCNDELNVCQPNVQGSSSAECTKRRENGDEGRITRSAKKKKELPSSATTIQTLHSALKKVPEALTRDSPAYRCNICNKTFTKEWRWIQHPRDHLKRFHCRKCGKRYALEWYFIKHQEAHTEQKPYKCVICDTRFKHYKGKLKHERRFHADATCFECVACEKMFNDKKSMIYHLRVDSGQKPPFRCQSCGKKDIFMVKNPVLHART